jgi:Family of unknown function (DUF5995)
MPAVVAVAAIAGLVLPAAGAGDPPRLVIGKGNLVAPLEIPANPRPGPVPGCRRPGLHCVGTAVRRLRKIEARFGCDHRAVFATTYRVLTQVLLRTVRAEPDFYRFPRYFFFEDGLFADVYIATSNVYPRGKRISPAWRIAFEAAAAGDLTGGQDMLLGINAHVQNDMPFVLAALGTKTRRGISRKADHDRANEVLADAYQEVVDTVERRYDPSIGLTNPDGVPADDVAGLTIVKQWREEVWRNAERLIATRKDPAAHRTVVDEIEENAATWARNIAASRTPGYGAQRDAYCEARIGG